ncbi:hypothetical protein [Nocardia sp. NPDC048505]|uniref:hypothetical protein n=1 Tax=unclassified Nocardia TaxID=2637762 RepID=UPI003408D53B
MKRFTTLLATVGLLSGGTLAVQALGAGADGGPLPLIMETSNSRIVSHTEQSDDPAPRPQAEQPMPGVQNPLPDAWGLLYR